MKTTILEGPDGRLYEIPDDELARFAVPGPRVAELRERLGATAAPPSNGNGAGVAPDEHMRLGDLPPDHPGYAQQQAILAAMGGGTAPAAAGGGLTLNIYVSGGPTPQVNVQQAGAPAPADDDGVEGYHMTFDANGIPVSHTKMLWGDYIDRQGNPAVGFHSHDPVHGNAQ